MNQFQKESATLQVLVDSQSKHHPSEGKIVRVLKGKHKNKEGVVKRHQADKFHKSYGSFHQELMREARGTYGFCCLVKTSVGEEFWVKADNLEIVGWPKEILDRQFIQDCANQLKQAYNQVFQLYEFAPEKQEDIKCLTQSDLEFLEKCQDFLDALQGLVSTKTMAIAIEAKKFLTSELSKES